MRLNVHTDHTHWKTRKVPCESEERQRDRTRQSSVFIITDKAKLVGEEVKGVGVMKDEELKFEEIEASHTLGG